MIKFSNQFYPDRQEESMATEIRQYACCIDNIEAEKIFKVTSMVLESILLIPVFVLLVKALRSVSNT